MRLTLPVIVVSLWVPLLAARAEAPVERPADAASFPVGFADFPRGVAWVSNPVGGVDAITLRTGKRLWRSAKASACGGLVGGNPLCWKVTGTGARATLTLRVLDRRTGKVLHSAKPVRNELTDMEHRWLDSVATGEVPAFDDAELICRPVEAAVGSTVEALCHVQSYVTCTPRSNAGCRPGLHAEAILRVAFDRKTGALTQVEWGPRVPVTPVERESAEWEGLYFDTRYGEENQLPRYGVVKRSLRAMRIEGEDARPVWRIRVSPQTVRPPRP